MIRVVIYHDNLVVKNVEINEGKSCGPSGFHMSHWITTTLSDEITNLHISKYGLHSQWVLNIIAGKCHEIVYYSNCGNKMYTN